MTERRRPHIGRYPDAAMRLNLSRNRNGYVPAFSIFGISDDGITAEQAREAAHLLNQLAEYLDDRD